MKFISAGHCNVPGPNYDPGAVGVNNRKEADETVRVRNRVIEILKEKGVDDIITDLDTESLREYLHRIKPGNASFVCEFHFNASADEKSTGIEVIIGQDGDRFDKMAAADFASNTASVLGLKLRNKNGVIDEGMSHRGRLGLMREQGIVILIEICFITNAGDMANYDRNFERLCQTYATLIEQYDNMIR